MSGVGSERRESQGYPGKELLSGVKRLTGCLVFASPDLFCFHLSVDPRLLVFLYLCLLFCTMNGLSDYFVY